MNQRTETKAVRLTAADPVELEPGVIMPAGTYRGHYYRIGLMTNAGIRWTNPQYKVEFSADQLGTMGARNIQSSLISESFTVTKFVQSGQIKVS